MSRTVKTITAAIESNDSGGGFVAVASTPSLDRDGEVLAAHCFDPLPISVACHCDHTMSASTVIGRAVPYYVGNDLHVNVQLASTPDAQLVRTKLAEGVLNSVSVAFLGVTWEQRAGVRTCIRAELIAVDVVSVPSNRDAAVLSVRGGGYGSPAYGLAEARRAFDNLRLSLMDDDLRAAKALLAEADPSTSSGDDWALRQIDAWMRERR